MIFKNSSDIQMSGKACPRTSRKGQRCKLPNSTSDCSPISPSDVKGSIFCRDIARMLLNLPVEFNFPRLGSFTGTVTNFDPCEEFGGAILHEVTFTDGDKQDYSYEEILQGHENYQLSHCPSFLFETILPNASDVAFSPMSILRPRPTPPQRALDLPVSFRAYPIRIAFESSTVQGQIVERRKHRRVFMSGASSFQSPSKIANTGLIMRKFISSFTQTKRKTKLVPQRRSRRR